MPRFNVTITFDLVTEIEPGYFDLDFGDIEGVTEAEDGSYWSRKSVESSGGQISFKVEAEDEDAVHQLVHEQIRDDMEIEDNDSVTWLVADLKVEVEEVEDPMDKAKAKQILRDWLQHTEIGGGSIPYEVKAALLFLLEEL